MPRYPTLNASGAACRNLTIASGAGLDLVTYTLDVSKNINVQGTLSSSPTGQLNCIGSSNTTIQTALNFSGDIRCAKDATRQVKFDAGCTFNDLIVDAEKCDLSPASNVTHVITGNITVAASGNLDRDKATVDLAGDITFSGIYNDSDALGGTFVAGDWTDTGTMKLGSQTVTFDGGGTSTIDTPGAADFYNLTITNNTTVTSVATKEFDVNNNLVIDAGSSLNCTDASDEVNGSVTNNGTIAIGDATLRIGGTYDNNGTTTFGSGILDANGPLDSTGGSLTFTTGGRIRASDTVTSLGTLTVGTGTVEYDNKSSDSTVLAGTYWDLVIDSSSFVATTAGDITTNDDLTVASGELVVDAGDTLQVDDDITLNGSIDLEPGTTLLLDNSSTVNVNSGATFESVGDPGYAGDYILITSNNSSDRYTFNVKAGAILRASKTYFRYMDSNGIQITDDATVTALTQLDQCIFDNGASGGRLLKITDNDNTVTLSNLQFFDTNSNLSFNVEVVNATATITIDPYDDDTHPTGFGGPANESDTGNDLEWGVTSPARLRFFEVSSSAGGAVLEWETAAEWRISGYEIRRSVGAGFHAVGPRLLPATGVAPDGSRYRWVDRSAPPGALTTYRLYEVPQFGPRRVLAEGSLPLSSAANPPQLRRAATGTHPNFRPSSLRVPAAPQLPIVPISNLQSGGGLVGSAGATATTGQAAGAVKILVERSGMTRVTRDELAAVGFDVLSNPANWRLRRDDKLVPFRVIDENTDPALPPRFGLDFLAARFEHLETNLDVYWLDVSPAAPGLRMPELDATTTAAPVAPGWSLVERRFEQDSIYIASLENGGGRDHWFWSALVAPGTVQIPIELDHVAATGFDAELEVWLEGWSQDVLAELDHRTRVSVNGYEIATIDHNGSGPYGGVLTVPAGLLVSGSNQLEIAAVDLGTADVVFLDRVAVRYPRNHVAAGGYADFSLAGTGVHSLGGFASQELCIYQVTGQGAPAALIPGAANPPGNGTAAFFADAGGGAHFEAFDSVGARSASAVVAVTAPQIPTPMQSVDLIVIAPERFHSALAPLVALRRGQGLSVQVVAVESVFDEYSGGRPVSVAIRSFVADAVSAWPRPSAGAVLLVGDATYDPAGNLGSSSRQVLPTRLIETPQFQTASDAWFVDLRGDDGVPELAIGRLPVATDAECRAVVAKIIQHHRSPAARHPHAIFVSDDEIDFEHAADSIAALFPPRATRSFYDIGTQPLASLQAQFIDSWRRGAEFVHYVGHGSRKAWAAEEILTVADVASLRTPRLPIVTAMNCLNGYLLHPLTPSLGEALLLAPQGGAVAYWGPTAVTGSLGQQRLATAFFELLHEGQHGVTLGEVIRAAKRQLGNDSQDRRHLDTWILLGDPMTRLR
ncbi:MAG: C25 family cysteine peptidase [Planctomycetota bacterium]